MSKLQFRVLYCEFLFRAIDVELLAPQGDIRKLLGQFAALLVVFSFWVLLPAVIMTDSTPSEVGLLFTWATEHFIVATTMLVVGLFAVLSWESMFPDRRDVMVLSPLPVQAGTLFLAKVVAVATALGITVLCLNFLPGIAAPFAFSAAPTLPPPKYDRAMAPVDVGDLRAVLDRDMTEAREPGSCKLALGNDAGIAIGVVEHGIRRVFTYGTATPDSIFEIGSVTKTFTGLLLAQMAAKGKVSLDEPVRELLPQGTLAKPKGSEITLLDLATQHSGLPRMPDNFNPADKQNPYADYGAPNLYAYIAKRGVARPAHPSYLYSNLGLGLLGQALANRAGVTYPSLLKQEITGPLGMRDTVVSLSQEQWERLIQGHSGNAPHKPVHVWDLDALAGAGGIRSTAGDMLTYLEAQLHPQRSTLSAALTESQQLRADVGDDRRIALAWFHHASSGVFEHSGATEGYTSYAFFHPQGGYAAVVLINTGPNLILNPEQLGEHIRQRLTGEPAVSLAKWLDAGRARFVNTLRSFAAYWITLFASSAFVFCCVLTVQGLAQLLPRQMFLRVSSLLQLACFCLLLTVYFLQAPFAGPEVLLDNRGLLSWLPSYWFFGLFQALNGPLPFMLAPWAQRAWMGLGMAMCGAAGAYTICYFRTLRKVAEQPDILPASRRLRWLPAFGNSAETAIGQFAVRTLLRSRQHRVVLIFYLGMALGLGIFISKVPVFGQQVGPAGDLWYQANAPLLVSSILMMCAAALGTRVVFSMPLELRANWIFQIVPVPGVPECVAATRRAIYGLALIPVLTTMAALFFYIWPWRAAAAQLVIVGLIGIVVTELSLVGFQKIPFACSYLPGRSYFHMAFLAFIGFAYRLNKGAAFERSLLENPVRFVALAAVLALAAGAIRWRATVRAKSEEAAVQFDDELEPAILGLGLQHRDGVLPMGPSGAAWHRH